MILLALALMIPQVSALPQKTKTAEAVVMLEDRSITLPLLPRDGGQGRARFKEVHTQISHAMEDLTLSLQAIYDKPEAGMVLPNDLMVPSEWSADGAALLEIIEDPEFIRLERDHLDTWKGWQAALVEGGLAKRIPSAPEVQEPRSALYEAAKQKGRLALQAPSRTVRETDRLDAGYKDQDWGDDFAPGRVQMAPLRPEEHAVELDKFSKKENNAQNRMALTNQLLPDLANTWGSLVNHLNERAVGVLNREGTMVPSPDATVNALRLHAKIAVLERFRKALWYCDLVWCQLAPADAPAPPRRLARSDNGPFKITQNP